MKDLKFIQGQLKDALELLDDARIDVNLIHDHLFEAKNAVDNLIIPVVSRGLPIEMPNFTEAAKCCYSVGYASTSLFTRRLNVPYLEAMVLMDELEDNKIVSEFTGHKNRELIMNKKDFEKMLANHC
jgi:DNA segregation ATPase FtsK/SpoIIIE-like protein